MWSRSSRENDFSMDETPPRASTSTPPAPALGNTRTPRSWNRRNNRRSPDSTGSISSTSSTVSSAPGPRPRRHPRRAVRHGAFRRIARVQIGLAYALRRFGRNCGNIPPARQRWRGPPAPREFLGDSQPHPRRDLLGATGILMRGGFEVAALERDQALVAALRRPGRWSSRGGRARANGEEVIASFDGTHRSARMRAPCRGVKFDHDHADRAVGLGLQMKGPRTSATIRAASSARSLRRAVFETCGG